MNWRKATRAELVIIAFHLAEAAPLEHIEAARAELKRREPKQYARVNYRGKQVYPR